jgi:hypothetical protein
MAINRGLKPQGPAVE